MDAALEQVLVVGESNEGRVKFLVELLGSKHAHTFPVVQIIAGDDRRFYAPGHYAASRFAALREFYNEPTDLSFLERMGRVRVGNETDMRRTVEELRSVGWIGLSDAQRDELVECVDALEAIAEMRGDDRNMMTAKKWANENVHGNV